MSNPYGRPCLPVADRRIIISATVKPAQRDFIKAYGGGSITRGIRAMIAVCSGLQAQAAQQRLTTEASQPDQHDVFKQQPEGDPTAAPDWSRRA